MNPFVAFVLGLLLGWMVEWVIDWFYWRRKTASRQAEADATCRRRVVELEQEVASYQNQLAILQTEHDRLETLTGAPAAGPMETIRQKRDSLDEIKGVSPAMLLCLNEAGIFTFTDLAALRPHRLREIAAENLDQPGSEVEIIKQARLTAGTIKKVDQLEVIRGIGPVIAKMLNNAGIFTFAELSSLTQDELREIVGEQIQRLANEDSILIQARQLSEQQN